MGAVIGNPFDGDRRSKTVKKHKNPLGGVMKKAKNAGAEVGLLAVGAGIVEGAAQALLPSSWRTGLTGAGVRVVGGVILETLAGMSSKTKPYSESLGRGAFGLAGTMLLAEWVLPNTPAKDELTTIDAIQTLKMAAQQQITASQPGTPAAQAVATLQQARAQLILADMASSAPASNAPATTAPATTPAASSGSTPTGDVYRKRPEVGVGVRYVKERSRGILSGPTGAYGGSGSGGPWGGNKFAFRRAA